MCVCVCVYIFLTKPARYMYDLYINNLCHPLTRNLKIIHLPKCIIC